MKLLALLLAGMFFSHGSQAAEKTETLYITAPQNDQVQPAPAFPEPAFAEPSKADALAVQLEALTQRVDALEKQIQTCGCKK